MTVTRLEHDALGPFLDVGEACALYEISPTAHLPLTDAVLVGAQLRSSLMGAARRDLGAQAIPSLFSGRACGGAPLDGHRHGYFLPLDTDRDGRLDHLLVLGRQGIDPQAQSVLWQLRWIRIAGRRVDVSLRQLGPTSWLPAHLGLRPASTWRSVTPFVLTRHPKRRAGGPRLDGEGRWIEGPEWQLTDELRRYGLPRPVHIEPSSGCGESVSWDAFRQQRRGGGGRRGPAGGHGFLVHFDQPVHGPIALGHGAHFGLGQLLPTPLS